VGTIAGLDYWTYPNWKKIALFSAGHKLNVLIHSVTSLALLLAGSSIFLGVPRESKVITIELHLWWLWLNPFEFKQALSIHDL